MNCCRSWQRCCTGLYRRVNLCGAVPRRDSPDAPSARRQLRDSRLDFTLPSATSPLSQARGDELNSPNVLGAQMLFRGECYSWLPRAEG